jgi:hypothetical protein
LQRPNGAGTIGLASFVAFLQYEGVCFVIKVLARIIV